MPDNLAHRATAADSDFRKLIDIAPVMIWVATLEGSCTYLSRSWTMFTGQESAEGLGLGWLSLIHSDDRPNVLHSFALACEQGKSYQVEYRLRAQSGEYRWVLDSASPVIGTSGAQQGFIGSIVDNQLHKTAELERDRSERRLEIALEASGIGIWQWDIPRNDFAFSDRARAVFGFAEGAVTFERLERVIEPADLPDVRRLSASAMDPLIRSHETYRYRIRRESDGQLRWIEAHGEAQFEQKQDQDVAVSYIGTFEDITAAIEQENRLKEESVRLALALDSAQLAVWELDVLNDRISPSPMLNVLYGFAPDASPSVEDLRSRYAPGERERLEQLGRETAERGEDRIRVEVKHIMPDGSVKWLLIQAQTAAPTPEGGPRAIGVVMDVTDRKFHEEKLAIAAREMQHRMKNSLALMQSFVQQSFRPNRTIEEGKKVFSSRLQAYVRVTDLLSGEANGELRLAPLMHQALSPFRESDGGQFTLRGPDVVLPERLAFGLALAIHELATNATKYGALSVAHGRVDIGWQVQSNMLHITWQETGGPTVSESPSQGFGTKLLRGALLQSGEGSVKLSFLPEGIYFEATLPLALVD